MRVLIRLSSFYTPVVGCLLKSSLQKGGHGHSRTLPPPRLAAPLFLIFSGGGRERGIFHPVLNSRRGRGGGCYVRVLLAFPISFMVTSNGEKGFAPPQITRPVVLECKQQLQGSMPTQNFFLTCYRMVMCAEDTVSNNDKEDEVHDGQG